MMNRIAIDQIATTLRLTESEVHQLLNECGIMPKDDTLSLTEADELMEYARTSVTCYTFRGKRNLENVVRRFTLFLDACTVLDDQFPAFMEHIAPILRENHTAMVVPSGVAAELKRLYLRKSELRMKIGAALNRLEEACDDGLVEIYGVDTEDFGDQQLLTIATCIRLNAEALFITKDNALSEDILRLNQLDSVKGSMVAVSRINRFGYLSRYIPLAEREEKYSVA